MEDRLVASTAEGYLAYCDGQGVPRRRSTASEEVEAGSPRIEGAKGSLSRRKARLIDSCIPLGAHKTEGEGPWTRPQNDEAQDQAAQGRGLRDGDRRRQKGAPPRTPLARLSVSSCCSLLPGH